MGRPNRKQTGIGFLQEDAEDTEEFLTADGLARRSRNQSEERARGLSTTVEAI